MRGIQRTKGINGNRIHNNLKTYNKIIQQFFIHNSGHGMKSWKQMSPFNYVCSSKKGIRNVEIDVKK